MAAALVLAVGLAACGSDDPEPNEGAAIVSIGDSVASGEGNPAREGRKWENRPCHRSATSGQTFAAEEARRDRPEVGLFNLSCSGATIDKGILGPYKGIEPALFRPGRAQIERLRDLAAVTEDGIAAVLVSIGANDVGFVKIVKFCTVVPDCRQRRFNPDFPLVEGGPKRPTLEQWVDGRLAELPERYARLAEALDPLVEDNRVIIVEYFDPTTAADGSDCTMLFGGVKPAESRWAREHVLAQLNERIEAAAEEHGWRVVTGVAESFRGHGLCAGKRRWVRTLGEGLTGTPIPLGGQGVDLGQILAVIGSTAGTLHPNEAGHRQIALLIGPVLVEALNP